MPRAIKLSELVDQIQETINDQFAGEAFWITAEITDVKKYADKKWCFLKFIEKSGGKITTEIKGVFWSNTYPVIEKFQKVTNQSFQNGIEITCYVRVRFHERFGLDLEVLDIDYSFSLGKMELEKQQTLEWLLTESAAFIQLIDGQYYTYNNQSELPLVFSKIALITAPNSDGQRDFKKEMEENGRGYAFSMTEFLTTVQGDSAANLILQQLKLIEAQKEKFDVVVIVRGGGSEIDLKPFDDYELSKYVAGFPVPVLAGIGHDRNTSIVDMMARQHKTPTKAASFIVDHNMAFNDAIDDLKERFFRSVDTLIDNAKNDLKEIKRVIKSASPETILNRGFAIITSNSKIITDPDEIKPGMVLQTILKKQLIHSTVDKKTENEKRFDF